MSKFRVGYLYSLAPVHCGGEGDLGNILEVVRESHTGFPYAPGSSLRGGLRNEVRVQNPTAADALFGKELGSDGQMGVHQVWFGDARLLWVPMRTMSLNGEQDVFSWVSCHSLIRDHALVTSKTPINFPDQAVGDRPGDYLVADARVQVTALSSEQKDMLQLSGSWPSALKQAVSSTWERNRIVLADADFQVLMEHALWTQVRNKIQEEAGGANQSGSAEVFWTDVCIPRDTIFYFCWGYNLLQRNAVTPEHHDLLMQTLQGLFQVGGQANIGRGWVQGWLNDSSMPALISQQPMTAAPRTA